MKSRALTMCLKHMEANNAELLKGDPFSFQNFMVAVTHVLAYAQIVQSLCALWLGLRFKFPLIWLPIEDYQSNYELSKYESESWVRQLMANQGYRSADKDIASAYDLTDLHRRYSHER